jgi:hypothetical protein
VTVGWKATDPSGICSYSVALSTNGGLFAPVSLSSATATSLVDHAPPGWVQQYSVKAMSCASGGAGPATGREFVALPRQETDPEITYSGAWTTDPVSGAYGGGAASTSVVGASASLTFLGRSIGWVARTSPGAGTARVYLDGTKVATVSLAASTTTTRKIVFAKNYSTTATHTIRIVDASGQINLDAFVSLGDPGSSCIQPPARSLIGWWSGDGNTNDSAGTANGSLVGDATYGIGEVGQAFSFSGAGAVSLGDPSALKLTSAITLVAWVDPTALPPSSGDGYAAIIAKWGQDAATDSYGIWAYQDQPGHLQLVSAIGNSKGDHGLYGGTVPLNTWTFVAATYDAQTSTNSIYVDGQLVATRTWQGGITTSDLNVMIGQEDSNLVRPFTGRIDEAQIYPTALNQNQLDAINIAGPAGECHK